MGITVILNGYKRGNQLTEQLNALNNGSVKPDEILLWYNNPSDCDEKEKLDHFCIKSKNSA